MYYPNFKKFKEMAKTANMLPVCKEIFADTLTPVSAFMKIRKDNSFLFESVHGGEKWGRFSFIGTNPTQVIKTWGQRVEVCDISGASQTMSLENPLEALKSVFKDIKAVPYDGLPRFCGGLVGYMGYENVRFFERFPGREKPSLGMPDMFFMVMDTILIFDSLKQIIKIVSNTYVEGKDLELAYNEAIEKIENIVAILQKETPYEPLELSNESSDITFKSSFAKKEDFIAAIEKSIEYIKAGDIFQVVIAQRFELEGNADPFNVYRALRVVNPSPYMFYLQTTDAEIVGASPEILVRLEGDKVTLRPIAGTRPRGETDEEDKRLEQELLSDPKEKAEHIMLVDLGRNDVGRVAKPGTVIVDDMMSIERYSHVMHIVTNVEGKLKDGYDAIDVLKATFPAGTVTGAPKVRAMEIIDELEPVKRGPYAGSVGYISYSGNMDKCITIRTLIFKDGKVYAQAGAGIVADSVPEREYEETINKAKAMIRAFSMAITKRD
ncbi:MAG: anthranilate synthase component I [Candidatus Magnetoovum sp. WYHC-5]|nr:anthranilate synthase component I [Candidatus Magnetoovum sp. WYHC-5]